MKTEFVINNYVLGARLRMCPTHKVVSKERVDERHTSVVFENLTASERILCEKALARKGKDID